MATVYEITLGTGFAFEIDGKIYILSNRHVVLGASHLQIGHSSSNLVQAQSYRICPSLDFAIIDIPQKFTIAATRMRLSPLKTGERAYVIGFPLGLNKSITQGLVNSHSEEYVQFDAPISSGNSGGPLVDGDGTVIGVVTAGVRPEAGELVQNLNLAINIAYVPKARVFVDPIVSFYDAWRELVKIERKLIDGLSAIKAIELHEYLTKEWASAAAPDARQLTAGEKSTFEEFQKGQADLLRIINTKHGTIAHAAQAVEAYLRSALPQFDKIPDLFLGLGNQELVREFMKDVRTEMFGFSIEPQEMVPSLKLSLEHVKAKYEDMAYRVEFLSENLLRLQERDQQLINLLQTDLKEMEKAERDTPRLPYSSLRRDSSEDGRIRLFFWTFAPVKKTATKDPFKDKLTAEEKFTSFGGFEAEILAMFETMAEEQLKMGKTEKALAYMGNEVVVRKYPDLGFFAFTTACSGDFERAYSLYQKALVESRYRIDPFKVECKSGASARYAVYDCLFDPGTRFTSYSQEAQRNLREFHQFVLNKPWVLLTALPSPEEVINSKAFQNSSEFEQFGVIFRLTNVSLERDGLKRDAAEKAINANPVANEAFKRLFSD